MPGCVISNFTAIWGSWNDSSTSTAITTDHPWGYWCMSGTGSTTITTPSTIPSTSNSAQTVWTIWVGDQVSSVYVNGRNVQQIHNPPPPTLEELARRELERQAYEAEQAKLRLERAEAEARAEKLMLECLSLRQRNEYVEHKYFVVVGKNKVRYRIRKGRTGNIDVVKPDGTVAHRLCAHPNISCPDHDTMLAQKLSLEHDEDSFIRVANRHDNDYGNQRVLEPMSMH